MGILAALGFGSKTVPTGPPPPVSTNTFADGPVGTTPYTPVPGFGSNGTLGWAPKITTVERAPGYSASHRLEPIPDVAPAEWYAERNAASLKRGKVEHLTGKAWDITEYENEERLNPYLVPVPVVRYTNKKSPSSYRFTVGEGRENGAIGLRNQTHLNGNHFSSATIARSYPTNGMQPATHFRNTNRVQPPVQGNPGVTDYGPDESNTTFTAAVSPTATNHASYRL